MRAFWQDYLHGKFVKCIQNRGQQVIRARKLSSAMSAAKAIGDHLGVWWRGTPEGEFTSMGVMSDGSYGEFSACLNLGRVFGLFFSSLEVCVCESVCVHRGLTPSSKCLRYRGGYFLLSASQGLRGSDRNRPRPANFTVFTRTHGCHQRRTPCRGCDCLGSGWPLLRSPTVGHLALCHLLVLSRQRSNIRIYNHSLPS